MEAARKPQKKCAVPGCTDIFSKRHNFPMYDPLLFDKWITQIHNPVLAAKSREQIYRSHVVCDVHFSEKEKVPGTKRGLKRTSFPTEHLEGNEGISPTSPQSEISTDLSQNVDKPCTPTKSINCPKPGTSKGTGGVLTKVSPPKRKYLSSSLFTLGNGQNKCFKMENKGENQCRNKRKKPDDDENLKEIGDKKLLVNDIMKKLFEMNRKYSELWSKYEHQIEVNNALKLEVADLKKQLSNEINKSEQLEIRHNIILEGIGASTLTDGGEIIIIKSE